MVRFKRGSKTMTIEEKAVRRPLFRRLMWTLGHVASGVLICSAVIWFRGTSSIAPQAASPPEPPTEIVPTAAEPELIPEAMEQPLEKLHRADHLLQSGSYAAALRIYDEINASLEEGSRPGLAFRRALCRELLGEPDHALVLYQSIVESSSLPAAAATAQLGQARTWWRMGKKGPARSLLFSLAVESQSHENVVSDAFHLLANLAVSDAFSPDDNLLSEKAIVTLNPLSNQSWLSRTLDLLQSEPTSAVRPLEPDSIDRFGADPSEIRLTMRQRNAGLQSVLQKIADQAQVQISPSSAARRALHSRLINVDVRDVDLATWLDGVLEPIGLVWQRDLDTIKIRLATELPRDQLRQLRKLQAQRLCQTALTLYPEGPLAPTTSLSLGNILYWYEDYAGASHSYHELIRRAVDANGLRAAWFNLSRAAAVDADFEQARQALFKCVDLSRGHPNEAICYLFLGRYYLDDGQSDRAIRQLIRSVSLARDEDTRRLAAETLALAYLIAQNPEAANMTLMDHRDILRQEPHLSRAGFLSSMARYRASSHPLDRLRSGRSLANSLAHVDPSRFFCFAAYTLVGDAYDELGLTNQLRPVLLEALRDAPLNDVRSQLMFRLGTHYAHDGQFAEAEAMMQNLVAEDMAPWSRRANLSLAELALRQHQHDKCLRRCEMLLQSQLIEQEKVTVLKLMGRAYEQQSEHYKAALCFAGLIPAADATRAGNPVTELLETVDGEISPRMEISP